MRLREWIDQEGLTFSAFGRKIGVGTRTVSRYCLPFDSKYRRVPDLRRMTSIYIATAGAVTPNDFHDLPDLHSKLVVRIGPYPGGWNDPRNKAV